MTRIACFIGALALSITSTVALAADAPSVDEIVAATNRAAYYAGDDGRAQVRMTITDSQARERSRVFTILRKDEGADGGDQRFYVYFTRPADVDKMGFLVLKHPQGSDDRWLYLPALDLVKRIAASDKRTSFVGSHFFYEDVSGRSLAEDTHELAKTTDQYYLLRNTPKHPDQVEFDHYDMWVHRTSFLPVKIEYFAGGSETPYRVYEVLAVEEIQGHPTVVKARMRDDKIGGETVLEYRGVGYDLGLPEDIFSERYLRTPPTEYLR